MDIRVFFVYDIASILPLSRGLLWFSAKLMGESRKFHLKLPVAMLANVLRPTGCRNSPEAEASWRLTAAAVAVRALKPKGVLPIFKDITDYRDEPQTAEIHIHLSEEDHKLLKDISAEEGGSTGELARKLLLTTKKIINDYPGMLNHDGLVAEMIFRFSPAFELRPLADW